MNFIIPADPIIQKMLKKNFIWDLPASSHDILAHGEHSKGLAHNGRQPLSRQHLFSFPGIFNYKKNWEKW